MSKEELIEEIKNVLDFNKAYNPEGGIQFSMEKVGFLLDILTEEKEEVTHKEEIRVGGLGTIVNDLETLDLLDIVEFRIKNILINDLHLIHIHNNILSELIKLREQLRP